MGEIHLYQPLTREDKITVVLYRAGIAISAVIISISAYLLLDGSRSQSHSSLNLLSGILLISLYASVGLSVFFIHLYVSKFHRALKKVYYVSVLALILLLVVSKGDVIGTFTDKPYVLILLIPLSVCLGFITAKEAFCFKLTEGYLLALVMPLYLLILSAGGMTIKGISYGLLFIAALLVFFTLRKVFMPIHYDIGDKSAYS